MAPLSKTLLSLLSLTALVSASPITTITSRTSPPSSHIGRAPSNETQKIWQPEMYNIYPQAPSVSKPPVSGLHVETFGAKSQLEQVAVFRGIPSTATVCTLGWSQANKEDRVFVLKGESGLTRIRQLSGLPDQVDGGGGISFSSVQPFDDAPEGEGLGPDFTFWDDEQYEQWDHVGGGVDCAEEIYIKVALRDPAQKASLYLGQDTQNGFWIEYQ